MKIKEWVVSQKELLAIGAIIGTLGVTAAVRGTTWPIRATAPVAAQSRPVVVIDSAVTSQDMRQLQRDISVVAGRIGIVSGTVDALLRVECITNPQKWPQFELAGIRCGELVPSTVQAGRGRRER